MSHLAQARKIKGLRLTLLQNGAQEIPQIDPPEAEKSAVYG
jgi:hypothetical protein